jgi:hypothetical protein
MKGGRRFGSEVQEISVRGACALHSAVHLHYIAQKIAGAILDN